MLQGLLSIDWLQFYVDCTYYKCTGGIRIERQVFSTRQYKYVDYIYIEDILTATLAYEPHSSALKEHTGLLKFSNEMLYHGARNRIVWDIEEWLGIRIISVSRIDLCYDFQKFKFGLMPATLIYKFIKHDFFKIGQAKYKLFGEQGATIPYSYLRFGTNTSPIAVYLYNKTLEFKQVKQKNYIVAAWEQCSFDPSLPVWRLEVSIKGNEVKYIRTDSGEMVGLTWDNLSKHDIRNDIFFSVVNKYFEFRVNDGQIRKDRMKRVELFDNAFNNLLITRIADKADTGRADKIFIKKLELLNTELRGDDATFWEEVDNVKDAFIRAAQLEQWYERNKQFWKAKATV